MWLLYNIQTYKTHKQNKTTDRLTHHDTKCCTNEHTPFLMKN